MENSDSVVADKNLNNVIKIDEAQIQNHLGEMVRSTVEEALNAMLDGEADQLCNARRYEHTDAGTDQRPAITTDLVRAIDLGLLLGPSGAAPC